MLATIASIFTIILFGVYIIGRLIAIWNTDHIWKDKILILDNTTPAPEEYGLVDEVYVEYPPYEDDEGRYTYGLLVSKEGIRNLKVFKAEDVDNCADRKKGKQIYSRDFLNVDQSIAIYVPLGEVVPNLFIEYTTYDYMKVEIPWIDNLKNGVFTEYVQPRPTWRSVMYQFFK